jgi:hypothetical protein
VIVDVGIVANIGRRESGHKRRHFSQRATGVGMVYKNHREESGCPEIFEHEGIVVGWGYRGYQPKRGQMTSSDCEGRVDRTGGAPYLCNAW